MKAEKIASGIMVVGLVLAIVGVAAPLAWYLGPLGPITHPALWLKIFTALCLFLCIGTLLALGAVMYLTCWLFDVRIALEKMIRRAKQRRAVRRQQQVA